MCFNNFLNMCAKTLNDSYFQTEGVFVNMEPICMEISHLKYGFVG